MGLKRAFKRIKKFHKRGFKFITKPYKIAADACKRNPTACAAVVATAVGLATGGIGFGTIGTALGTYGKKLLGGSIKNGGGGDYDMGSATSPNFPDMSTGFGEPQEEVLPASEGQLGKPINPMLLYGGIAAVALLILYSRKGK